jgi:tetratricopeptide (TPR) repeat protein
MGENRSLQQAVSRLDEQLAARPEDLRLLELRARASERLDAWEDAAQFWQRLVKACRAKDDRAGEARACLATALAYSHARGGPDGKSASDSKNSKANGFFQRAIAAFELLRDELQTTLARVEHARHLVAQRDGARARPLLERACPVLEANKAWSEAGWCHAELAVLLEGEGNFSGALAAARASVEATERAVLAGVDEPPLTLAVRLSRLASIHLALGDPAEAREVQERALPLLRSKAVRNRLSVAYKLLLDAARLEEDPSSEERWLTEAVIAADRPDPEDRPEGWAGTDIPRGRLRLELAKVVSRHDEARARRLVEGAIRRLEPVDDRGGAEAWLALGELRVKDDVVEAVQAFSRATDLFRRAGDEPGAERVVAKVRELSS